MRAVICAGCGMQQAMHVRISGCCVSVLVVWCLGFWCSDVCIACSRLLLCCRCYFTRIKYVNRVIKVCVALRVLRVVLRALGVRALGVRAQGC
jgi:hypothetical protein